jgi:uncharacterized repeat protein (TIGR03803 family)
MLEHRRLLSYSLTTLARFNSSNGQFPDAALVEDSHGNLFGTTEYGGAENGGEVFEVPYDSKTRSYDLGITVLASFDEFSGASAMVGMILDSHGNLFGTTEEGGTSNYGAVFEVKAGSNAITVLASFNGTNGANPTAGVIEDSNGDLFGTTVMGGFYGDGTVFEVPYDSKTGSYDLSITTLVIFSGGSYGAYPLGGLVEDSHGNLFGTTSQGGTLNGNSGDGSIFEIPYGSSLNNYDLGSLALFNGSNGDNPELSLIEDSHGNLFGTTEYGGSFDNGTFFEMPYDSSTNSYDLGITTLVSLNGLNGGLFEDSSGNLFGTESSGGASGDGTVYEIPYDNQTSSYDLGSSVLYSFIAGPNGQTPQTGLIEDPHGNLFGTTGNGNGTVFELSPTAATTTVSTSQTTVVYGTPVTLKATVAAVSGNSAPTAGSVDFYDTTAGRDLGAGTFSTSTGTTSTWTLTTGVKSFNVTSGDTITVTYTAGFSFGGSSGTVSQTVTARAITVTAAAATKSYDDTTSTSAIPAVTGSSLVAGDTAAFGEYFNNKNAGTSKTLTPTGTINDGDAGADYSYTYVASTTGSITPLAITVTAVTDTKVYDGGTAATTATPTVTGGNIAGGDTAAFIETYNKKNVGTGMTLTPAGSVSDGNSGNNYSVTMVNAITGSITPLAIIVSAATSSKGYDGTTSSAIAPTVTGGNIAGGDTAAFTESFDTKNVGSGKTLTPAGLVSDGNGGNNYSVTLVASTAGQVTARAVTVTAAVNTKGYDGTISSTAVPTVTGGSLAGGDTAAFSESYGTENAGTGLTLTPAGSISDGNGGNNYSVTLVPRTTGQITARAITVTVATSSKAYDGTTSSSATPTITSGNLVTGDTAAFSEIFDTKNVGTGKTLLGAGSVNDGNGGRNYAVSFVSNTTGQITVRAITVTAVTSTKTYDGTTSANATPTITGGSLASGDAAAFSESYGTKNAGTGLTLTPAGSVNDGNGGNNYAATFAISTAGTINKANAKISVTGYDVTYDRAAHTATGTATGVGGVNLSGLDLSGTTHVNAGSYTGDGWTFTDVTGNYTNASGMVSDNIAQAVLTITANNQTRAYGAANPTLTCTYAGFVNGDNWTSLTTLPTLSTIATTASYVGTYPIQASGAVAPNYSFSYTGGILTVTSVPVAISVVPLVTDSKSTLTISGSAVAPSPNSGIASVNVVVNGTTTSATISGNTWADTISTPAAGTYSVQVTASDNAGNSSTVTVSGTLVVNTGTTLSLGGTSFSFTGGLTPASWTILVNGSKQTVPSTTTTVVFTGTGSSATATITGASATGESAAISLGQATFNGVGNSGPYTVTATNLLSATITSGGSGSLSVTDANGGNALTELPTQTTLTNSSNTAETMVAKGFNNVVATATGAGSSTVANLVGSSAADTFTANPESAVMEDTAQTAYRLEADGFATVHGTGGTGDTALLTDAAGGSFNATGTLVTLSGSGYSIVVSGFVSVQATAVGPSDLADMQAGPGTNVFTGSKGKSTFKGINFDNIALGFFTVDAYGSSTGYNTGVLTDSAGNAMATLKPQTATLTDASARNSASYQINLESNFQIIQALETSLLTGSTVILKGSSTTANTFTSTATTALLTPSAGNTYREYEQGFATVQATSTYATDTASLYDSPGSNTFTATPASATMRLATGKTVIASGFKTVNAYAENGTGDTANVTDTNLTGTDSAWLWDTNALMKMNTGNTVRAWYFAKYNLQGNGTSGDTVTTLDATVLPTKKTSVNGATVIAWLTGFAEMNQDYSAGSQNTNKSYAIAVDQVLTAYWS